MSELENYMVFEPLSFAQNAINQWIIKITHLLFLTRG